MKTIYYPGCFKKAWNNRYFDAVEYSPEARTRLQGLRHWEELRNEGFSACRALGLVIRAFGGSADYWYRWRRRFRECGHVGLECRSRRPHHVRERTWDSKVLKRIVTLRDHPETCRWGASKLRVQLLKEGRKPPSVATLERMIAHLKHTKAILPLPVAKKRSKRKLSPSGWRTRFHKAVHGAISRIQIDVDSYRYSGRMWYHFSAIHVPTRWVWARSYSRATARNATAFLSHIRSNLPPGMPVETIQVDGGSEFMKEFSASCEDHGIALLVNHPHTPQQNCFVERVHRTFDEELYQVLDIPGTLTSAHNEPDTGSLELEGASSVTTASIGGTTYLFVAGQLDNGVSVFSIADNGTLTSAHNESDTGSLELEGAYSVTTATIGTTTYLFVAGFTDGGLSVFSVADNGVLTNVHNEPDAGSLELSGAFSVTTASIGGNSYLFVAGLTDDGVSVFSINE